MFGCMLSFSLMLRHISSLYVSLSKSAGNAGAHCTHLLCCFSRRGHDCQHGLRAYLHWCRLRQIRPEILCVTLPSSCAGPTVSACMGGGLPAMSTQCVDPGQRLPAPDTLSLVLLQRTGSCSQPRPSQCSAWLLWQALSATSLSASSSAAPWQPLSCASSGPPSCSRPPSSAWQTPSQADGAMPVGYLTSSDNTHTPFQALAKVCHITLALAGGWRTVSMA